MVSDLLLETYPRAREGQLSKMRAALVNEKTLAEISKNTGMHECVRLGKGEKQTGGHEKPSILSSALEALIAAIYLDGGFNAVYPVVRHLFSPLFGEEKDLIAFYDYKTQLQEMMQARWKFTPTYDVVAVHGPDHAKTFEVSVCVNREVLARATGFSKKEAEQNAARSAIEHYTENHLTEC